MIRAAIIGATGYAGAQLARLLYMHPEVQVVRYGSRSQEGKPYASIYGAFRDLVTEPCGEEDLSEIAEEADVIFTATPQGYLASVISEEILEKAKVIDLSADFRFHDTDVYEAWYKIEHQGKQFVPEAVYGLCELHRSEIPGARLVANPGCYTTCSILSLFPLVKDGLIKPETIVIDAKSGTSGAGRGAKVDNLFCEVNENVKAYGVATHRHTPEIEQELTLAGAGEVTVSFTPHLIPMQRGILVTAYANIKEGVTEEDVAASYQAMYGAEPFVRLLGSSPAQTRFVSGSNYCDIGWVVDKRVGRVVVMAALDNLIKGAAGQAVQNMNLMFGFPETMGLEMIAEVP